MDVDSSADSIAQYHVTEHGWPGIGYAFVVHWDGSVEWCHDLATVSYHVASRNRELVGICIPGDWTRQPPPTAALDVALDVVMWIRGTVGRVLPVRGHSELALPSYATTCPGSLDWLVDIS